MSLHCRGPAARDQQYLFIKEDPPKTETLIRLKKLGFGHFLGFSIFLQRSARLPKRPRHHREISTPANSFPYSRISENPRCMKSCQNHLLETSGGSTKNQNSCNPCCKTVLPAFTFDTSAILKSRFDLLAIEIFTCHENHGQILIGM